MSARVSSPIRSPPTPPTWQRDIPEHKSVTMLWAKPASNSAGKTSSTCLSIRNAPFNITRTVPWRTVNIARCAAPTSVPCGWARIYIKKTAIYKDHSSCAVTRIYTQCALYPCRCTSFLLGFFAQRKFTLSTLTLYISSPFSLTPSLKVFNAGEKICNLYHESE